MLMGCLLTLVQWFVDRVCWFCIWRWLLRWISGCHCLMIRCFWLTTYVMLRFRSNFTILYYVRYATVSITNLSSSADATYEVARSAGLTRVIGVALIWYVQFSCCINSMTDAWEQVKTLGTPWTKWKRKLDKLTFFKSLRSTLGTPQIATQT